ncbi:CRISPR-associated endonuclease Cas3'' [Chamaesiphon minutus]|uniref:HD domain-containing protein n=1 Tax=Chamaesiphon minutus (strain ATCC 27169 / PCC 6605) TaxID=1173020 RepID=K9UPZ7_CHAP6|nr:CRISPR-associated endonuclease Cas3'' [Chamaesiphon minutus]AFY97157.1 HD domain-containing protein [Chamaesiphon minutus PCC 6605]
MTFTPLARPNQPLLPHLLGVGHHTSRLCSSQSDWARLIGLLHDYGKYRPEWVEGINAIANGENRDRLPHHAVEGALYLIELFPDRSHFKVRALALLIAAHHGGLGDLKPSMDWLAGKDSARPLPDMDRCQWKIDDKYLVEVKKTIAAVNYSDLDNWMPNQDYRTAQRLRFLYGALIAADRQDAAMSDGWKPAAYSSMTILADKLATWYEGKFSQPKNPLDILRGDFYVECRKAAKLEPGWLSVRGPCGISKTWSVMQMALDHAAEWDKQKVIYCVPWTAILGQSYSQYQDVLGADNVLGHWSTLVDPDTKYPEQLRNSRQWWETPVIATTMVQLFDVLLGSRARTAQRMPSLQNAVIVLDEVQGLPNELLITCIRVLDQLVQDHGVTIILSTATMPDYAPLGINPIEALPQAKVDEYFAGTKRVEYRWAEEPLTWETVAAEIVQSQKSSTLIVTNTVAACDDVYTAMQSLPNYRVYKYTASMSPAHRGVVLAEIKAAVDEAKEGGNPVIICATSAIETGVDLDCTQGYRELSGLESIVQFAGRINRNKKDSESPVTIFKTAKDYPVPPGSDRRTTRTLQAMAMGTDLQSPDVLTLYSKLLLQDAISSQQNPNVYNYLEGLKKLEWDTVSQKWQMISPTTPVLVNPLRWGASSSILAEYDEAMSKANYRVLQRHCVGLYKGKYQKAKDTQCVSDSQIKGLGEWVGTYDMGVVINANP